MSYTCSKHEQAITQCFCSENYLFIYLFIILFIYLKSTTEGPENHLYCREYMKIHTDTPWKVKSLVYC